MISSKQDQRSAVGLVTGGSIRGPHSPLPARLANCSIVPRLMRGRIERGGARSREEVGTTYGG